MTDGDNVISPSQRLMTIWLDPGKTTGIAGWDYASRQFTSIEVGDDLKALGLHLELLATMQDGGIISDTPGRIEIGWERYVITPGNTRHGTAYWSLETIGVARYLALKHDFTILKPQMSSVMTAVPDGRLKAIGWHKPGKPHANDAARHLLRYMLKAGLLPIEMWEAAWSDAVLGGWPDAGLEDS
jgi:hypothetical protein